MVCHAEDPAQRTVHRRRALSGRCLVDQWAQRSQVMQRARYRLSASGSGDNPTFAYGRRSGADQVPHMEGRPLERSLPANGRAKSRGARRYRYKIFRPYVTGTAPEGDFGITFGDKEA
jgi:hypothetical protein